MGDFEVDTRLESSDEAHSSHGASLFRGHLSEDWRIWGPNGGYLAAVALRAAGLVAAIPRPASFHGHFLRVGAFEEIQVRVTSVRVGRRSESFRVEVHQHGKALLEALVRTAAPVPGLEHDVVRAPEAPAPESLENADTLIARKGLEKDRHAFWQNLERRPLDPDRVGRDWEAGPPEHLEWYRFRPRDRFDEPFLDAARSLLLLDTLTWPAAVQPHAPEPGYIAPNLDVTAWFHDAAPDQAWLLAETRSPLARGGLMGTHGRVFSRDGRLLASGGAQLFCVPEA